MTEQEVLRHIVERLRARFDVKRVILFGSRARGDHREDSDYDVLAEVSSSLRYWDRQRLGREAIGPRTWSVDLLILTPDEVQSGRAILGSAVDWALEEGKVVYGG